MQKLSPQQIQFIKLLQMNTLDFEEKVSQELLDNPALEGEDKQDDPLDYKYESTSSSDSSGDGDFGDGSDDGEWSEYQQDINVEELLRAGGEEPC